MKYTLVGKTHKEQAHRRRKKETPLPLGVIVEREPGRDYLLLERFYF